MGRRSKLINFTSLFFKPNINGGGDTTPSSSSSASSSSSVYAYPWAWPSCKQAPRTDSFRSAGPVPTCSSNMFKTVNSVYFDSTDASFSSSDSLSDDVESEETVIRGLVRSDRLLYEPGGNKSSSILSSKNEEEEEDIMAELVPFKESVALAVESSDPYGDFRRSMEEMVAAHGTTMRSWECLEELLVWYLRVNGKKNHGFIVSAFVDLLVNLAASDSNQNHDEIKVLNDVVASSSNSNSPISSSVSFEIEEEGSVSC